MFFRYKVSIMALITSFIFTIGINTSLYAERGKEAMPVPSGTEEFKSEIKEIAGKEFDFTHYEGTLSAARIKKFYRRELPKLGWEEKDLLKDAAGVPGFQISPELRSFLASNLMFQRDGQIVTINFIPEEYSKDEKTRYTISQGEMDFEAEPPLDTNFIPNLLTEPKMKDLMPGYPGASLINIFERRGMEQAAYITRDEISDVVSFYKRSMPDYGWFLKKETPITSLDLGEFPEGDISARCPACPKGVGVSLESIEMFTAELIFSDDRGETCKIFLSTIKSKAEMPVSIDMTTILVQYGKR